MVRISWSTAPVPVASMPPPAVRVAPQFGQLTVWLSRRDRDPFIDQAGREALNFGISIAIYGLVALVAALMLVGIPLLMVG